MTEPHSITGSTPLHEAARGGHDKVVSFLLQFTYQAQGDPTSDSIPVGAEESGMDINFRNKAGCTALELGVSQGHCKVVR